MSTAGRHKAWLRVRTWSRRTFITVGIVVILLLLLRLALPSLLERAINDRLARVPGYVGSVERVDLSLLRGAYRLHQVRITKKNGAIQEPFFSARDIDFSVAWRQLFRGQIVSDIHVDTAEMNIVRGPNEETSQTEVDRRWQDVIDDIFPIEITYLAVDHSVLKFIDRSRDPPFDVHIKDMHVQASGLRNRPEKSGKELPATVRVEGDSLGGGKLKVFVQANPLAEHPHFHFTMRLEPVSLSAMNKLLQAHGNVDVSKGTFRLFVEVAARGGRFEGYVKPFFEDLEFKSREDKSKNIAERVWEKIVAGLVRLLKNKPRDQLGTRIPIAGEFGDPKTGVWAAVRNVFHHGFIRAFTEDVEGTVQPAEVEPAPTEKADAEALREHAREEPKPEVPPPPPKK